MDYIHTEEETKNLESIVKLQKNCQLVIVEGMLENYCFAITNEINSCRDHQWMLKPLDKRSLGNKYPHSLKYHSSLSNYKGKNILL